MSDQNTGELEEYWHEIEDWQDVTREERHFCAHLYECIRIDESKFICLLNKHNLLAKRHSTKCLPKLNPTDLSSVGFEVAFYRDLRKFQKKRKNNLYVPSDSSSHRKFDLALFFKDQLVIVEAKAQQGFSTKDFDLISRDKKFIRRSMRWNVSVVGISSCRWFSNTPKEKEVNCHFDGFLTWNMLAKAYPGQKAVFDRANCIYRE